MRIEKFYVNHFLRPQLDHLGTGFNFMRPWHVEIFGAPIELGDYVNVVASSDKNVRLAIWSEQKGKGSIQIGDYCLICSGVRIGSAHKIQIGDSCMIASSAYITDCDWHDIYDRIAIGKSAPVHIANNVWVGDSAIICKGVQLGENCIIGAGAVVVGDVPANTIAAGNPARVVKKLDPDEEMTTRAQWFADPTTLFDQITQLDKKMLRGNTFRHWLRHLLFPRRED